MLSIVVTSWDPIWNPALNEYDINLDTNLDGVDDQAIVLADYGAVTTGYADGTVGCFFVDTLDWLGGGAGAMYDINEDFAPGMCTVSNLRGSSILAVEVATWMFWDDGTNSHGASFTVTSYNGGGWDSDQTERVKISFDDVASGPVYEENMDAYIGQNMYGDMSFGFVDTSSTIDAVYAGFGDGGWGSDTLGWLFWNPWSSGPATEVYEVIAGY